MVKRILERDQDPALVFGELAWSLVTLRRGQASPKLICSRLRDGSFGLDQHCISITAADGARDCCDERRRCRLANEVGMGQLCVFASGRSSLPRVARPYADRRTTH